MSRCPNPDHGSKEQCSNCEPTPFTPIFEEFNKIILNEQDTYHVEVGDLKLLKAKIIGVERLGLPGQRVLTIVFRGED